MTSSHGRTDLHKTASSKDFEAQEIPARKAICTAWIGRFGNQCHSYLYGKFLQDIFNCRFYVPSFWEGAVLFKDPAPIFPSSFFASQPLPIDDTARFDISFQQNVERVSAYNKETSDSVEFVDPNLQTNWGKSNIAFSSLVTDSNWLYPKISLRRLKSYFQFTDEVLQSRVYQELEAEKGTYDAAHFRRTDTAVPGYTGGHCMISKQSYLQAFDKFGVNASNVIWVSDEPSIGWKWPFAPPVIGGVTVPWLPDFLKLVFARRLFRANSAFSIWAGWLSEGEIISPKLHEYAPGRELDVQFVEGNHPHWMGVKGAHNCYELILKQQVSAGTAARPAVPSEGRTMRDKILMVHWNGRFGNRMFSFAFGRLYAELFNHQFVIPSAWEGTVLFKERGCQIIEDDELRLKLNQSIQPFDCLSYRTAAVKDYCDRTGQLLSFINPDNINDFGKRNVYFDSLCAHGEHIFGSLSKRKMLDWFSWSDEVRSLDLYKRLEDEQGTYDIAHLRRDDVSNPEYNRNNPQAYSVISKKSYLEAFESYGFSPSLMQWVSDDRTGKWMTHSSPHKHGGWNYPIGSNRIPDVIFDWLPDFLRLYFARTIFRSNSSFSWWAAFLSPCAKVYSPVLGSRKIYMAEEDEIFCNFVEGNHPHWLNCSNEKCPSIHIND